MNIFWFRRDLRLIDNAGFYHALKNGSTQPIFIFDKNILDQLPSKRDARVEFIHNSIVALNNQLKKHGSCLWVYYGYPEKIFEKICQSNKIEAVYANADYESYAKSRDAAVAKVLDKYSTNFFCFKDHVIFDGKEVLKDDGKPYTVFTPYKKKWLAKLKSRGDDSYLKSFPSLKNLDSLNKAEAESDILELKDIGFERAGVEFPPATVAQRIIKNYAEDRDFPSINGTSKLGIHFRFGTISIREKARAALSLSEIYLSELIWRDFYSQILQHFPHVETRSFRPAYDLIPWRNNEQEFEAWCNGITGYPLVDAGMRELNATGFMHNRVRMVVASFLCKHLLIDWRWGEAYFAQKLLDFDLASNNGGWQWAAGSGTDAAPYFRIFNPESQQKRFDKNFIYIKKWIPEYGTPSYPEPIVDHKFARERCLSVYKETLNSVK